MNAVQAKLAPILALLDLGKAEQARQQCLRVVQSHGADAGVLSAMAMILVRLGRVDQAVYYTERAAAAMPTEPELLTRHGHALVMLERWRDAIAVLERANELAKGRPEQDAAAVTTLAAAYAGASRFVEAARVCESAAARGVEDAELTASHAYALLNSARAEDGVAVLRRGLRSWPDRLSLLCNLANMLNYVRGGAATEGSGKASEEIQELFAAHEAYGSRLAATAGPMPAAPAPRQHAGILRVGILSPDLRRHSVACFMEAVFRHHDRARIELHVYSTNLKEDAVSSRLKAWSTSWSNVAAMGLPELAARLRQDRLDALVELSGLTAGQSLGALALRPVAAQISAVGYPNTTGVPGITARFVDSHTDPPGHTRATERLVRLDPCFLCYAAPEDAPQVGARADGPIVFGSFNAAQKIGERTIVLWASVLRAVEGSRLLLKATNFADPLLRDEIARRFAAAGIDPERVEVKGPEQSTASHLAAYAHVDIGLDPTPYHGTTTTCEAMWMGVPVVTLAGVAHAARVGVSLLRAVGLEELIARDEEDYVRIAKGLAQDRPRLARMRAELRDRVAGSVLCDGAAYARRWEAAVRSVVEGGA